MSQPRARLIAGPLPADWQQEIFVFEGKSIAVVVPCYNEETQIGTVIETMPDFVDRIIVIDDVSPDGTVEVIERYMADYPKVELIRHDVNKGVGAAIGSGYARALELEMDIAVVMAGDAQMPPGELPDIIRPVSSGIADYSKANRLIGVESWETIPRKRFIGNSVLSFMTKIASGYYQIADSQTGYTAISKEMLRKVGFEKMYGRYGYPNDMLVRLNVARARVADVESVPVYDVGEVSGLKIHKVVFTMSWLLWKKFWWRLWNLYVVRDFHPLALFYVLGILMFWTGMISGIGVSIYALGNGTITGPTAVLIGLLVQSGLLLTLFGMLFDFEHNRSLSVTYH